ncbi:MAG: rod shape-determining protein MreD [Bacteroidetes bacterium HGW-Bacteroidetes-19]|nr:MAG: rod shape-determining protein MreD [Bacteroidetes bacterium HGW-Bacteroidetes-19]
MNNVIPNLFRFFIFVVLQLLVFNNIKFLGYINPQIYIIFLLLLPLELKKWVQYIIAFLTGLLIDMFFQTFGIHALSSLIIIFIRPYLVFFLNGFKPNDGVFKPLPGFKDFKWIAFYVGIMAFVHQFLITLIETFNMSDFFHIIWVTILNTFFTTILIVCIEYLFYSSKKK